MGYQLYVAEAFQANQIYLLPFFIAFYLTMNHQISVLPGVVIYHQVRDFRGSLVTEIWPKLPFWDFWPIHYHIKMH